MIRRMIVGCSDRRAEALWNRQRAKHLPTELQRIALKKLILLDAAATVDELRLPPGNRLEKLKGDRAGRYSIRINQQWRICFRWESGNAHEVEIVDYH